MAAFYEMFVCVCLCDISQETAKIVEAFFGRAFSVQFVISIWART